MQNNTSQIYAHGYEKWEGERGRAIPPWLLIGQNGLRNLVSSSGCFARLIFGGFFIIYYFQVMLFSLVHFQLDNLKNYGPFGGVAEAIEQLGLASNQAAFHMYFILIPSLFFTTFAMLFYGSQLISKDKRANAMQVYFAKAISRSDYVLGKFFSVGILTASLTLVPSALILVMGVFLTTDHMEFFRESWYIPFLTGGYWLMLTVIYGSLTLAFSSFFNKSYMAGVGVIGFQFFCWVFALLATEVLGAGDMLRGTDWTAGIYSIGTAIFKLEVNDWSLLIWQIIDLGLISSVAIILIYRNIRPVEVVK